MERGGVRQEPLPQLPPYPTATAIPTVTPGPAPEIALPSLDGEEMALSAWEGKSVLLNFWATWCFPCREEMPALAQVDEQYEDVVVVGVNFRESAEEARAFIQEYGLTFPILLDEEARLADAFGVLGLPTTIFINADGLVTGSHLGPLDANQLQEAVDRLRASAAPR